MSGRPRVDVAERFRSSYVEDGGCWIWQGALDPDGYGYIRAGGRFGKRFRAHRFAYELHKGAIPLGLTLDHLCRRRACVNPAHLEAVTNRENLIRGTSLRSTCRYGHPLDGLKAEGRYCKTCHRERMRLRRESLVG